MCAQSRHPIHPHTPSLPLTLRPRPYGQVPLTCEADGALEGAAHALEAVLDQVA